MSVMYMKLIMYHDIFNKLRWSCSVCDEEGKYTTSCTMIMFLQ